MRMSGVDRCEPAQDVDWRGLWSQKHLPADQEPGQGLLELRNDKEYQTGHFEQLVTEKQPKRVIYLESRGPSPGPRSYGLEPGTQTLLVLFPALSLALSLSSSLSLTL